MEIELLLGIVIVLILVGVGLYFLNTKVPMDDTIKMIINIVVVLAVVLWLLSAFLGITPKIA